MSGRECSRVKLSDKNSSPDTCLRVREKSFLKKAYSFGSGLNSYIYSLS